MAIDPVIIYFEKNPSLIDFIYKVEVIIDASIRDEWLTWMKEKHIPDVMQTSCFLSNSISEVNRTESASTFSILYCCASSSKLIEYLTKHADKIRAEHTSRYQGKFSARRSFHLIEQSGQLIELKI